jgi:hypothetical protein
VFQQPEIHLFQRWFLRDHRFDVGASLHETADERGDARRLIAKAQ